MTDTLYQDIQVHGMYRQCYRPPALGDNDKLNLKQLSYKMVMLLALARPSRSADLNINRKHYKPDGPPKYSG